MQDFFFTVLVIWLLFRIFGSNTARHVFTVNVNKPKEESKKEGEMKVNYIPPKDKGGKDEGEYTDYEEVK